MKNYIILLLMVLMASQAYCQKKKKESPEYVIDSLSKSNDSLKQIADSLTVVSGNYAVLYNTIKEKVLKRDFDPAMTAHIIDSLAAGRDSSLQWLTASTTALTDSLKRMNKSVLEMKQTLKALNDEENYKNRLSHELRQLKELHEAKILTTEEFAAKKSKILQKWQ